jgi:hypothetical protein
MPLAAAGRAKRVLYEEVLLANPIIGSTFAACRVGSHTANKRGAAKGQASALSHRQPEYIPAAVRLADNYRSTNVFSIVYLCRV